MDNTTSSKDRFIAATRLTGDSEYASRLRSEIHSVASGLEDVAIYGETGTGKKFIADLIHRMWEHATDGCFLVVDPGIGDEELRVILFEEGRRRIEGMLARKVAALRSGTTIYFQNISAFSIINQTRIVRFIAEKETGIHSLRWLRVIFGVTTPWNSDEKLGKLIDSLERHLRKCHALHLAPLRERAEDIPVLVSQLLRDITDGEDCGYAMDESTMCRLITHPWPDNIRELKGVLREAVQTSSNGVLQLPSAFRDELAEVKNMIGGILSERKGEIEQTLQGLEQSLLRRALIRTDYDLSQTRRLLGLSAKGLRYRLKKFGISLPPSRKVRVPSRRTV